MSVATLNTITVEPNAFDVLYDFLPLGVMALARDRSVKVWNRCLERWSGFAPFQRLHGADKCPGSGMGLAICKRAVERHGGTIWTEAQGGACFKFTLMDEHDE